MIAIQEDHPIVQACFRGDSVEVKRHLDSGIHPNDSGWIIAYALAGGNLQVLDILFEYGIDINKSFNDLGEIPLMRVIEKKKIHVLEYLLNHGANAKACASGNGTSLHAAAAVWPEAIPLLLQHGTETSACLRDGRTPIMCAAFGNQIEALKILHAAGVSLEQKDNEGTTSLILASKGGKLEAVKWLLEHGADINAEDERGKTALDWAKANGHAKVVESLQKHGGL